ncbi:MAG: sulfite exporter TauE/SafE family protein, partial [Planctomycetota bacterium]
MDYLIFAAIGIVMGLFGGLLGIGGSVVMIPALVFALGEDQHLYQASAMICNFFVGTTAAIVHRKADVLVLDVIKWLVPAAAVGIIIGVAVSNSSAFARGNSYLLARVFGLFLIYVVIYNYLKLRRDGDQADDLDISKTHRSIPLTILCGLLTGVPAGLLGIGGGTVCVPAQQLFLRMPLKRAISNSAATIASIALVGAFYKN